MSGISGIPSGSPVVPPSPDQAPVSLQPVSSDSPIPTDAFVPTAGTSTPPPVPARAVAPPSPTGPVSLRPAQLDEFFRSDVAHSVLGLETVPPTDDAPHGAFKVTTRPPFDFVTYNSSAATTRVLSCDAAFGTRLGSAAAQDAPFGRWIRMSGGWVAQSVRPAGDRHGEVLASMLSTWLPDSGPMEMSLHEICRDGSGTMFRLDIEGSGRDFSRPPAVMETFHHAPGEPALPPFFHPVLPTSTLSPLEAYLGRIPVARFDRAAGGAWSIELADPKPTVRSLKFDLRDSAASGTLYGGTKAVEGVALATWTRVPDGWECVMDGIIPPEQFGRAASSCFTTRLGDDGHASMTVRVENLDGTGVEHSLDPTFYVTDHVKAGQPPRVLVEQPFGEPRFETRVGVPQGRTGLPPELSTTPPPRPDGGIRDEGEWIIIGGVRVRKK